MAYGACDDCGSALHECECGVVLEFEIALPATPDRERHVYFDVRAAQRDGGEMDVSIALVEEQGGVQLDAQRRRVLAELWQQYTGKDLYDYIEQVISRCGQDT